jgi:hypothetical protein
VIVTTTKGDMDAALLTKQLGVVDNDNEHTEWVEYWLDGELVHRSVHVTLKQAGVTAEGLAASLG